MDFDIEIFKGKSFSSLMKDIYANSAKKDRQISGLIGELKTLIKNVGDATLIVPLIKEYLEVGVKNDEHLVKLAAVVQRIIAANINAKSNGDPSSMILSESERDQLLSELDNIENADKDLNKKVVDLTSQQKQLESDLNDIEDGII